MLVRKLYEIEKECLEPYEYKPGYYFTFMKDCNDNWCIPNTEAEESVNPYTDWVRYCPLIEYCPIPNE